MAITKYNRKCKRRSYYSKYKNDDFGKGPVTIGAFNFPDVIKVKYEIFCYREPTSLETDERWFAKNVGEIYQSGSDNTSVFIYNIMIICLLNSTESLIET